MIMRNRTQAPPAIISVFLVLGFLVTGISLPVKGQQRGNKLADSVTVKDPSNSGGGPLFARINGKDVKIADFAVIALRMRDGQRIVYTSIVRPFGFSSAPFPVFCYDVPKGQTKRIFYKRIHIDALREITLSDNRTVLIGRTSLETKPYSGVIVLDPDKGELLYREHSLLTSIKSDTIEIADYSTDEETWNSIREQQGESANDTTKLIVSHPTIKPARSESIDLKTIKLAVKQRRR